MMVFFQLSYLIFGLLFSQIRSLRITSKLRIKSIFKPSLPLRQENCHDKKSRRRNSHFMKAIETSSTTSNEQMEPFSAEYLRNASYMRLFQVHLDLMYQNSLTIKCPFFRRRATDSVDGIASIAKFILARHKSLPIPIVPGSQMITSTADTKLQGLSVTQVACILNNDWKGRATVSDKTSGKGYYITGRLTKEIYQDNCFFDGPDPDMPVTGLKKYISSTSQLFDHKGSRADMTSLEINEEKKEITVKWRLEGILNLPWHPRLKPWTGQTTYFIDDFGLIDRHVELWDIPVIDAFVSTLFPFLNYGALPAPPIEHYISFDKQIESMPDRVIDLI